MSRKPAMRTIGRQSLAFGAICLALAGCAAGALGAGEAAFMSRAALAGGARLGIAEAGVARLAAGAGAGGLATESFAAGSASRLAISRAVAASVDGNLGRALNGVASGRATLMIHSTGLISSGSEGVAALRGSQIMTGSGRVIGYLDRGWLVSAESGAAVGRLHGIIPQRGALPEFASSGGRPVCGQWSWMS
ncbi:MAG: hypothetical protein JWL76_2469 [Thermoleophilia bacterium]|nr:hypothetical protein [Thermoleophilia bacterium]